MPQRRQKTFRHDFNSDLKFLRKSLRLKWGSLETGGKSTDYNLLGVEKYTHELGIRTKNVQVALHAMISYCSSVQGLLESFAFDNWQFMRVLLYYLGFDEQSEEDKSKRSFQKCNCRKDWRELSAGLCTQAI